MPGMNQERRQPISSENPYHTLLGVEIAERGDGTARIRLPVSPRVQGGAGGAVHGGVISALVDIAALHAISSVVQPGETMAGTAELNVSYLRPAFSEVVYAVGRVLKKGRTLAVAEVDIMDGTERLLATGRVAYSLRPAALARRDGA
jgi:uncharacterized protein (TIGR00369 family)